MTDAYFIILYLAVTTGAFSLLFAVVKRNETAINVVMGSLFIASISAVCIFLTALIIYLASKAAL